MRHLIVFLAACSHGSAPIIDGPPGTDTAIDPPDMALPGDEIFPWRHTIVVDGIDDFLPQEQLATTSTGYDARITWDQDNIYIGYGGPDLDPAALDTATKWLFIAIDTDPGNGTGALTSLPYNTQHAVFPSGFGAELYARYKCDASFSSLEKFIGPDWMTSATAPTIAHAGSFVEVAIPRAALGTSNSLGIVTWMINEKANFEGSFAGLYAGNFTDGYQPALPLTKYLRAELLSPLPPNAPGNQAP